MTQPMAQGGVDPLSLPLKDFHLPAGVDWWPLAVGWWLLIASMILIALGLYFWCRKTHLKKPVISLFKSIKEDWHKNKNTQQTVKDLSIFLRQCHLLYHPHQNMAGLTGKLWLKQLDQALKTDQFSQGAGKLLLDAPYQAAVDKTDLNPLFGLIEEWIKAQKGGRDD